DAGRSRLRAAAPRPSPCPPRARRVRGLPARRSSLDLRALTTIFVVIRIALAAPLAGLRFGRQAARDSPARLRSLALVALALGNSQILVDADDQVPDDRIDHAQPAIDLSHQVARPADRLHDVDALAVMPDLVGQLAPAPVVGLLERAVEALHDLLDLPVQIVRVLLARFRREDVDELVLSVL